MKAFFRRMMDNSVRRYTEFLKPTSKRASTTRIATTSTKIRKRKNDEGSQADNDGITDEAAVNDDGTVVSCVEAKPNLIETVERANEAAVNADGTVVSCVQTKPNSIETVESGVFDANVVLNTVNFEGKKHEEVFEDTDNDSSAPDNELIEVYSCDFTRRLFQYIIIYFLIYLQDAKGTVKKSIWVEEDRVLTDCSKIDEVARKKKTMKTKK